MTSSHLDKRALELQKKELDLKDDRIKRREQRNEQQDKNLSQRKNDLDKKESLLRKNDSDLRQKLNEINAQEKKVVQKQTNLDTLFDEQSKKRNIFLFVSFLLVIVCTILGYFTFTFYQEVASKNLILAKAEKVEVMLETSVVNLEKEKNALATQLSKEKNKSFTQNDQIEKNQKVIQQEKLSTNRLTAKLRVAESDIINRQKEWQLLKVQVKKLERDLADSVRNSASVGVAREKLGRENKQLGQELFGLNKKIEELNLAFKEQFEELKKSAGIIVSGEQTILELTAQLELEIVATQEVSEELANAIDEKKLLADDVERGQLASVVLVENNQQLQGDLSHAKTVNKELNDKLQLLQNRIDKTPVSVEETPPATTVVE